MDMDTMISELICELDGHPYKLVRKNNILYVVTYQLDPEKAYILKGKYYTLSKGVIQLVEELNEPLFDIYEEESLHDR